MGNVREDLETYYDSLDSRLHTVSQRIDLHDSHLADLEQQLSTLRHHFNLLLDHFNLELKHVVINEDRWEIERLPLKGD